MPEHDFNNILSAVLRLGVVISLILLVAGVALLFANNGGGGYTLSQISSYNPSTAPGGFTLNSSHIPLSGIVHGLSSFDGIYYITLGLWVLIFTPISIVVIALAEFLLQKNRLYVVLSLIVLFDLLFAMLIVPIFFQV